MNVREWVLVLVIAALGARAHAYQPTAQGPVAPLSVPDPHTKLLSPTAPLLPVPPDWERQPDAASFPPYSDIALNEHVGGVATVRCGITANGLLASCIIESESPRGYGFGRMAIMATRQYKMRPQMPDGASVEGFSIEIPMTWPAR